VDLLAQWFSTLDPVTLTQVVRYSACSALVITYRHTLPTQGADRQALQQRRTFARRPSFPIRTARVRIVAQAPSVLLELLPADVGFMCIAYKRDPFLLRESLASMATVEKFSLPQASKAEGAGTARVVQHVQSTRVPQVCPYHLASVCPLVAAPWELQALLTECLDGGGGGTRTPKCTKELVQALLNAYVWVQTNFPLIIVYKTDGQAHLQLSAARFVENAPRATGRLNVPASSW
jgi:hypothetical protein